MVQTTFSLYLTVYRFEVWLPFVRYLGFFSRNPLRSNSLIALFTVLRDKPRSEAIVLMPGQQDPDALARSRRYM